MTEALNRCLRIDDRCRQAEVSSLLVTADPNRRYLSGFSGSAGALLVGPGRRELFTDGRYEVQSAAQAQGFNTHIGSGDPALMALAWAQADGQDQVGFDDADLSVRRHRRISAAGPRLVSAAGWVEELRLYKDEAEIATLRQAVAIADEVMGMAAKLVAPGVTERAVAANLYSAFLDAGAEKAGFDIIVATGINSARPHHMPSNTVIAKGDAVVVDLGALLDGYHSDITRTFCAGQPGARFCEIYQIVLAANRAGIEASVAGAGGKAADAAARAVIDGAGYGDFFGHGLGHGVGLEIHEAPRLAATSTDTLGVGMVHSIEPGIYLPDWGGIRIEDLVLIGSGGPEILTATPR